MFVCPLPALECTLPGPWQDSQPIFLALSPGAISLACVAVWNVLVIAVWHWTQSLEPTNVAPGTCGGMRTVRVTVAHDTNKRPHTAMPPKIRVFVRRKRRE